MNSKEKKLIGVRVPSRLQKTLSEYCLSHGVKINYFVAEAIKEKLDEILEERIDREMLEERLRNPQFISSEEFEKYLRKREIAS